MSGYGAAKILHERIVMEQGQVFHTPRWAPALLDIFGSLLLSYPWDLRYGNGEGSAYWSWSPWQNPFAERLGKLLIRMVVPEEGVETSATFGGTVSCREFVAAQATNAIITATALPGCQRVAATAQSYF